MDAGVVIFLARKLGWTLDEIGQLSPHQATTFMNELVYQEEIAEYKQRAMLAGLTRIICMALVGKAPELEDIAGLPPLRAGDKPGEAYLLTLAKQTRKRSKCGEDIGKAKGT